MKASAAVDTRVMGTAHMQCGLALMQAGDTASLHAALRHFDRAIDIRRRAACEGAFAAFALAASWMNRAEALQALGEPPQLEQAIAALSTAVALLETLPSDENRRFTRRLATALQNRALARARLRRDTWMMAPDLFRALDLLCPAREGDDPRVVAALWVNVGIAQLLEPAQDAWRRAIESAHEALRVISGREWSDARMAEVALRARYLCCQAAVRILAGYPPDAVPLMGCAARDADEGVALVERWQTRGASSLASLAADLRECSRRLRATAAVSRHQA